MIAVEVMTVEPEPRLIELRGTDALKVVHAYGVNGIITEVEVPLAPLHPWVERVATFPTVVDAARFGYALTAAEGIAKKEVCILDGRIVPYLKRLAPLVDAGAAMAILMVSEPQTDLLAEMVAQHGGKIVFSRNAADAEAAAFEGKGTLPPLYEYTWNHTTLHAIRADPGFTYLQVRFPAGTEIETVAAMEAAFGDEVLLHLEFQRRGGRVFLSALPLVRFTGPDRLLALVAEIAAIGGDVSNPHSYVLDNAGWKRTDAPQPEFKAIADPLSLMNPGKLKTRLPP